MGSNLLNLSFSREESHLYLITDSRLIIYLSYKFKGESNPYLCPIFKGEFEAIFSRFTIEYFFKDFQCLPLNFFKGKICIVTMYKVFLLRIFHRAHLFYSCIFLHDIYLVYTKLMPIDHCHCLLLWTTTIHKVCEVFSLERY